MNDTKNSLFSDTELIAAYSRQQAIEDGVLVDVSETAREAGFRIPVALTAALWADIEAIPQSHAWQDVAGRLWDVLNMALYAIRSSKQGGSELLYTLEMPAGNTVVYRVKLVCGPGDDAEPVVTLMCPGED